jgi:nitrogen-specific signal transduction histidine kinase
MDETPANPARSQAAYFRASPCLMSVQDRDRRILDCNDRFVATFGEPRGRHCYEAYKGRTLPCAECPVDQTFQDGQCHSCTETFTLPDERQLSIMVYTSPVRNGGGEVEAVVKVVADVTPIKSLEAKLRESRERFRLLFEEVPCYISVQNRELKIVQANRRFQEDFGNYVGAYCYEVYKHRGEPCLQCPVARTFQDGKIHNSEEVVTALSGCKANTLVSTAPIRNSAGEIEFVMEMSANITQIRELQGQLTNLGLLVGSISHGIKGLLTGLDGGVYLLNTGLDRRMPERVEEGWLMIRRNVEHIRSMVLDLLYVAKEREPVWEPTHLREMALRVAKLFRRRAQDMRLEFLVEVDAAEDLFEVEPKSLEASLVNILENAFDACRVDSRKDIHTVQFGFRTEGDYAVFVVQDDGLGMDRETRERLFSLFFSSKGAEGTGLGLFIANKVIEKHRGSIEVESDPGSGTRFRVKIPRLRENAGG